MSRLTFAAVVVAALTLSCKINLTPESISKAVKGVRAAREDLTPENEYYVGRAVATNILARGNYKYRDAKGFKSGKLDGLTAYVNAVGSVVANAALDVKNDGDREPPIAGWHFVVLEDKTINAFAAPGGFVFVTAPPQADGPYEAVQQIVHFASLGAFYCRPSRALPPPRRRARR